MEDIRSTSNLTWIEIKKLRMELVALHDVWPSLAQLLSWSDIVRLLMVGDKRLDLVLRRSVTHFRVDWSSGYLALPRVLSLVSHLPRATHLSVKAQWDTFARKRLKLSLLSPLLESLTLCFQNSIQAILCHSKLVKRAPNLRRLHLSGHSSSSQSFVLHGVKYPPQLTSLVLQTTPFPSLPKLSLDQQSIQDLPKTLTELEISYFELLEPRFFREDFPPGLTSLSLTCKNHLIIESFPRTLSRLHLDGPPTTALCAPSSAVASRGFAFPWRSYFPSMTDLMPCKTGLRLDPNGLVQLLDPMAAQKDPRFKGIADLISEDLSLPVDRSIRYTHLSCSIEEAPSGSGTSNKSPETEALPLLPLLNSLVYLNSPAPLPEYLKQYIGHNLTRLQTLKGPSRRSPLPPSHALRHHLSSITAGWIDFSDLPPSLTSLVLDTILGGPGTDPGESPPYFPAQSLRQFSMSSTYLTLEMAGCLPATIEVLCVRFPDTSPHLSLNPDLSPSLGSPDNSSKDLAKLDKSCGNLVDRLWSTIAGKLVQLKEVVLWVGSGSPSMRLTPFASQLLEKFIFNDVQTDHSPWAMTLLDDCNTAGRPRVFPPSLTYMCINAGVPISSLALVPRSVTHLVMSQVTLEDPLPNCPFLSQNVTHSELFERLPPKLKHLQYCGSAVDSGVETCELRAEALSRLPKSLEHLSFTGNTVLIVSPHVPSPSVGEDAHFEAICRFLPPGLSLLHYRTLRTQDYIKICKQRVFVP